jgi:hypothetical protein
MRRSISPDKDFLPESYVSQKEMMDSSLIEVFDTRKNPVVVNVSRQIFVKA